MPNTRSIPRIVLLAIAVLTVSARAQATYVTLNAYTDDYGEFYVDGVLIGSYDGYPAANIIESLDLTPGWHDLAFTYRNRYGTNYLALQWMLPGDTAYGIIPELNLRSLDATGAWVSGLRGDYYSLAGVLQFTRFGEGPIWHGATSFTNEIYEGNGGLWAGVYGPSALFEERLTGQLLVPGTPVPDPGSSLFLFGIGLVGLRAWRKRLE